MIKVKHVLLFFFSLLLCLNVSSVALANTTSSHVGIYFTEKIKEKEKEGVNNKAISNSLDEKSNETSSYLPQTGEHQEKLFIKKNNVLMLGIFLLIFSIIEKKRRKKMKLRMMLVTGIIGSTMLAGPASAAIQDEVKGSTDGKSGESHGYIKLIPGNPEEGGVTEPAEPTDPPGGTDNEGDLTLDNIAPLLFETHKLEGKEQVYTSVVTNSNVQVTDKRGEEAGWNVQVSQTDFVDSVDKNKILKGAKLILPIGKLKDLGNVSLAPELFSIEVNNNPAVLMNAATGSGAGTWTNIFDKDEIKLTVPAGNKTGEYMSTITWTLMDAPK
ncbi:WxL domain-containing protein [Carnobacterium maltaromaticum]|uniref:WxL domain-containing protein n=1 Tax=Carnobacterium maltaromaticum TaxID=2751 RepID=A0AAW9K959_CARML|nr:WxL domain-containing protein [Carnobacterium maltaromaticum]MDZ5760709.1 WxL domain-containing protein [Carnobacterium maltaromaticum]